MKIIRIVLPLLFAAHCFADLASNITFKLKQPEGSSIKARQEGNEWFRVLETADDYILRKPPLYAVHERVIMGGGHSD